MSGAGQLPVLAGVVPILGSPGPCAPLQPPFGLVDVLAVVVLATTGLIVALATTGPVLVLVVVLGPVLAATGPVLVLAVVLGPVLAATGLVPSTSREEGLAVLVGGRVWGHRCDSCIGDMVYETGEPVELIEGRPEVGVVLVGVAFVVVGSVAGYIDNSTYTQI